MVLSLGELKNYDFSLSKINIFYQNPTYHQLSPKSRKPNGFLYIVEGNCHYYHDKGDFPLSAGAMVYLPSGSHHTLIIESEEIVFYRIDFQVKIDDELVLFSDAPMKLCSHTPTACVEAIQELAEGYQFVQDSVAKTALVCRMLHALGAVTDTPRQNKLAPATAYLLEHLTEKVSCAFLAKLCCLSTAQFYNLFHAEYGVPPLEYRNNLLVRRAKLLLKDGSFSVTEVAELLGFESVSYFSRFFKNHTGLSPAQYIKKHSRR